MHSFTFLDARSSSLLRSARFSSSTRPFSSSVAIFVPCVRVTKVLPQLRVAKTLGALISYHSFLRKGSPAFFLPPFVRRLFLPTAIALSDPGHFHCSSVPAWLA